MNLGAVLTIADGQQIARTQRCGRRSILPIELIRKYENDSFWLDPQRNPYNVKVV
jgi:sulfotransferase